ncbi:YkgJ family cysteine cluster protein [Candidatus Omnitrophota bacterium]
MIQLKQFIPREFCLRCDVCCRFLGSDSIWAPLFTKSEVKYLVNNDILPPLVFTIHPKDKDLKADQARINLVEHKDCFVCPCLEVSSHKCKIYTDRPFECRFYPFLLVKRENEFYVAKDKKCPYFDAAKENVVKNYIDYLKNDFNRDDSISFLKQNQELFTVYPAADLELLFPLEIA